MSNDEFSEIISFLGKTMYKSTKKSCEFIYKYSKTGGEKISQKYKDYKSIICPYCFQKIYFKDVPFRCTYDKCVPEVDLVRKKIWGESNPLNAVIYKQKYRKKRICKKCYNVSQQPICTKCHMEFPSGFGDGRNLIISVVGGKGAGKSHYILALCERMRKEIGPNLKILMEPMDDRTKRRYNDYFYDPVYNKKEPIGATHSGMSNQETRMPLLFSLKAEETLDRNNKKKRKYATLAFFDTAGEDLLQEETVRIINRYIAYSDGILLIIDPLQINVIREKLIGKCKLPAKIYNVTDIIKQIVKYIYSEKHIKQTKKISIPLAVTISKMDILEHLLSDTDGLHLKDRPIKKKKIDFSDNIDIDGELQTLLEKWNCRDISHQISTHFEKYLFFAVSALGCSPDDFNSINIINPNRVEDPFLWLLNENNFIFSNIIKKD